MNCIVNGVPKNWTYLSDFHFHLFNVCFQKYAVHESWDCGLSYLLLLPSMQQKARLEEALMIIYKMSNLLSCSESLQQVPGS